MNNKLLNEIKEVFSALHIEEPFFTTLAGNSDDDYTDYFFRIFSDYGLSNVRYGASKIVLYFRGAGFVIKLPFYGFYDDCYINEETSYRESESYEFEGVMGGNYIEEENRLYSEIILKNHFEQFFIKNKKLCETDNGIPVYWQEEVKCFDETHVPVTSKARESAFYLRKKSPYGSVRDFPLIFVASVISHYGERRAEAFFNFLTDNDFSDLRTANIGFRKNGYPIILDYAGFYD